MVAAIEIEWEDWLGLHPDSLDRRRPFKEPILGISFLDGQGGIAFSFGALRDVSIGDLTVVHTILGDGEEGRGTVDPVVVSWYGAAAAAMAFTQRTATRDLTFEVRNGAFVDMQTGTQWSSVEHRRERPLRPIGG